MFWSAVYFCGAGKVEAVALLEKFGTGLRILSEMLHSQMLSQI